LGTEHADWFTVLLQMYYKLAHYTNLPNLHGTLDRNGNADWSGRKKSSWDKLFWVISVETQL